MANFSQMDWSDEGYNPSSNFLHVACVNTQIYNASNYGNIDTQHPLNQTMAEFYADDATATGEPAAGTATDQYSLRVIRNANIQFGTAVPYVSKNFQVYNGGTQNGTSRWVRLPEQKSGVAHIVVVLPQQAVTGESNYGRPAIYATRLQSEGDPADANDSAKLNGISKIIDGLHAGQNYPSWPSGVQNRCLDDTTGILGIGGLVFYLSNAANAYPSILVPVA